MADRGKVDRTTAVGGAIGRHIAGGLSAIVPILDAGAPLGRTLRCLGAGADQIIVVDGGSRDDGPTIAAGLGAQVIVAPRGRGSQLAAGAAIASGRWLLFVHGDTVLAPGWEQAVAEFAGAPENRERAACFRFALDLDSAGARWLERYVAWRTGALGLPYGDQGLLIEARFYRRLGGFPPIPIMEDVALVRRIGRARMTQLGSAAVTSGARYTRTGVVGRGLRNLSCLALYFLGVPPALIARLYR